MYEKCVPAGVAACLVLSACSGGGAGSGGVGSGGSGGLPAPPPTNSSVADLKVSQSFTNDAAVNSMVWDLKTSTGVQGSASRGSLTVRYDAGTRAYSVGYGDRSQSFAPADQTSDDTGSTTFTKKVDGTSDRLTLNKLAYDKGPATQYVRLGYWQHNTTVDGRQPTDFVSFTYGIDTPAAAVPRSGSAAYRIGTFGVASAPGGEPRSFSGTGTFSVDLGQGLFNAHSDFREQFLVTPDGLVGGGIELNAGGSLSSTDGTFSGNVAYGGGLGKAGGTLAGRFYGPNAEELGATFTANNSAGLSVNGSFVGLKDPNLKPENFTFANLNSQQLFYTRYTNNLVGQLNWQNADTFTVAPPTSDLSGGQFTLADKVESGSPNLTTYKKSFNSTYEPQGVQHVTLELYKPGSGNSELALTYSSFGHWATATSFAGAQRPVDQYFSYGFATPSYMLAARTGSAQYDGVVYASGNVLANGTRYAVTGTSRFNVDFGALQLTGTLTMAGKVVGGGTDVNFGAYDFSGKISAYGSSAEATIMRDANAAGSISVLFYGPDAREIGAPFYVNVPTGAPGSGAAINGVAIAKQR